MDNFGEIVEFRILKLDFGCSSSRKVEKNFFFFILSGLALRVHELLTRFFLQPISIFQKKKFFQNFDFAAHCGLPQQPLH